MQTGNVRSQGLEGATGPGQRISSGIEDELSERHSLRLVVRPTKKSQELLGAIKRELLNDFGGGEFKLKFEEVGTMVEDTDLI